jgi:hypothetical protein
MDVTEICEVYFCCSIVYILHDFIKISNIIQLKLGVLSKEDRSKFLCFGTSKMIWELPNNLGIPKKFGKIKKILEFPKDLGRPKKFGKIKMIWYNLQSLPIGQNPPILLTIMY